MDDLVDRECITGDLTSGRQMPRDRILSAGIGAGIFLPLVAGSEIGSASSVDCSLHLWLFLQDNFHFG